jgi:hypothetical protein
MSRARRNLTRKAAGETLDTQAVAAQHFTPARASAGNTRNNHTITPPLHARHTSDGSPHSVWTRRWMAYPRTWTAPCNLP